MGIITKLAFVMTVAVLGYGIFISFYAEDLEKARTYAVAGWVVALIWASLAHINEIINQRQMDKIKELVVKIRESLEKSSREEKE